MNIFVLDKSPVICAQYHCDKHIVKMPLEYTQLMWTYIVDKYGDAVTERAKVFDVVPYKPTHRNHPCNVWLRESTNNFIWLFNLWVATHNEYTVRYGRTHASFRFLNIFESYYRNFVHFWSLNNYDRGTSPTEAEMIIDLHTGAFTKHTTSFKLAMPDEYKGDDPVESYRRYYRGAKSHIATWKTQTPEWFNQTEEVA